MKIRITIIAIISTLMFYNCKSDNIKVNSTKTTKIKETLKPGFIHAVYFWFHENADPKLKDDFLNGLEDLAQVKSIQSVYYGPPAGTDRDVVDNSYDYAWITNFATSADHDAYQVDPIHLDFIDQYKSLWKEVKVYDNNVSN